MAEAAKLLPNLEKEDLRILMAIEIGMRRSEYVKISDIKFYARYPIEETLYRLKKAHKYNLIIRNSSDYEISYTLNSQGYDVLAWAKSANRLQDLLSTELKKMLKMS